MPWHTSDLVQQREDFVKRADVGEEYFSRLCLSFGISRLTGYRWLRRCAPVFFPVRKYTWQPGGGPGIQDIFGVALLSRWHSRLKSLYRIRLKQRMKLCTIREHSEHHRNQSKKLLLGRPNFQPGYDHRVDG
jgi:hypothetical protein